MSYAQVVTDSLVLVIDTDTGEEVKFMSNDSRFEKAVELIKENRHAEVFKLDTKHVVTSFFEFEGGDQYSSVTAKIKQGNGILVLHNHNDMEVPMGDAITKKILKMAEQGFDCKPLLNFLSNLYDNPSKTAIDELYLFIEACELPITTDGYFIAYKIVKSDYTDIYTGKMDNNIGQFPSVPRALVDTNRHNTCSYGLHFCSKGYLNQYGSSNRSTDRCMLVKINPADVVAIPSDYNNAKGRAWVYEVVGELPAGWRGETGKDYTDKAVVASNGQEAIVASSTLNTVAPAKLADYAEIEEVLKNWHYTIEDGGFYCIDFCEVISPSDIADMIGNEAITEDVLEEYLNSKNSPSAIPFPAVKAVAPVVAPVSTTTDVTCTHCGSALYISKGMNSARTKRRFKCKGCDGTFYH